MIPTFLLHIVHSFTHTHTHTHTHPSLVVQMVKSLPSMQETQVLSLGGEDPLRKGMADPGSVPGWGRSPEEGNGYPSQYSCLENPIDIETWWATVHRSHRVGHD